MNDLCHSKHHQLQRTLCKTNSYTPTPNPRYPRARDNLKPYIYTNPPKDTKLSPKDKVFVLEIFRRTEKKRRRGHSDDSEDSLAENNQEVSEDRNNILKSPNANFDSFQINPRNLGNENQKEKSQISETKKILENNRSVLSNLGRNLQSGRAWKRQENRRVVELIDLDLHKVENMISGLERNLELRDEKIVSNCLLKFKKAKKRVLREKKFI